MGTSLTSIAKRLAMQMLRPDYTNPWYRPLFVPTCRNVGSNVHIIGRVLLSFDRESMAVIIEKRDMAHTRCMFFLHPFTFK